MFQDPTQTATKIDFQGLATVKMKLNTDGLFSLTYLLSNTFFYFPHDIYSSFSPQIHEISR